MLSSVFSSHVSCTFLESFSLRRGGYYPASSPPVVPFLISTTVALCVPASHHHLLFLPPASQAGPWPNLGQSHTWDPEQGGQGQVVRRVASLGLWGLLAFPGCGARCPNSLLVLQTQCLSLRCTKVCSLCAHLARVGLCWWQPSAWLIPTCQEGLGKRGCKFSVSSPGSEGVT